MPTRRSSLTPSYGWNPTAKRYVWLEPPPGIRRNSFVSWERVVRPALDAVLDKAKGRIETLSRQLVAREITIAEWQTKMASEVKQVHVIGHTLASGGWGQLTQADYGRIGQRVRAEYVALRNFAIQVEEGKQARNGTLVNRARLYSEAGRATYEAERGRREVGSGAREYRSVRHATDSCEQCISEAAKGWVMVGTLIPIGQRLCRGNCKCTLTYR